MAHHAGSPLGCAVSGAAVNDLVYDYSLADDISADRASMPGSPFVGKNMAVYRSVSPLTYYRNVRTPTLNSFGYVRRSRAGRAVVRVLPRAAR